MEVRLHFLRGRPGLLPNCARYSCKGSNQAAPPLRLRVPPGGVDAICRTTEPVAGSWTSGHPCTDRSVWNGAGTI